MFNIAQYLEKFKNLGQTEKRFKETFILIVKEIVGVDLKLNDIIVKNGEAIIKTSPAIKNAIYIKKQQIQKKIREKIEFSLENIR